MIYGGKIYNFFKYKIRLNEKKKLIKYINNEHFDLIFVEAIENIVFFSEFKDKLNCNVIGCWHHCYNIYLKKEGFLNLKRTIEIFDNTVVLCKNDQKLIKQNMGVDVIYIYNSIPRKNITKSDLVNKKFIAVGRYKKIKGFDNLIKSFKIFNAKNKEWTLDIVGEGTERSNLQKLINEYKLNDYVKLKGQTSDMDSYYKNASVFLMPSRAEGFGMVVLEAMQYGLPIIAYDLPVFQEILPKEIKLVEQEDYKTFASQMLEYVNNKELLNNIIKNYDTTLEKFYFDNVIKEWKKIIN